MMPDVAYTDALVQMIVEALRQRDRFRGALRQRNRLRRLRLKQEKSNVL